MPLGFLQGLRSKGPTAWSARVALQAFLAFLAWLAIATPARAQYVQIDSFDVTPFVGVRFGGTFDVQTEQSSLEDIFVTLVSESASERQAAGATA